MSTRPPTQTRGRGGRGGRGGRQPPTQVSGRGERQPPTQVSGRGGRQPPTQVSGRGGKQQQNKSSKKNAKSQKKIKPYKQQPQKENEKKEEKINYEDAKSKIEETEKKIKDVTQIDKEEIKKEKVINNNKKTIVKNLALEIFNKKIEKLIDTKKEIIGKKEDLESKDFLDFFYFLDRKNKLQVTKDTIIQYKFMKNYVDNIINYKNEVQNLYFNKQFNRDMINNNNDKTIFLKIFDALTKKSDSGIHNPLETYQLLNLIFIFNFLIDNNAIVANLNNVENSNVELSDQTDNLNNKYKLILQHKLSQEENEEKKFKIEFIQVPVQTLGEKDLFEGDANNKFFKIVMRSYFFYINFYMMLFNESYNLDQIEKSFITLQEQANNENTNKYLINLLDIKNIINFIRDHLSFLKNNILITQSLAREETTFKLKLKDANLINLILTSPIILIIINTFYNISNYRSFDINMINISGKIELKINNDATKDEIKTLKDTKPNNNDDISILYKIVIYLAKKKMYEHLIFNDELEEFLKTKNNNNFIVEFIKYKNIEINYINNLFFQKNDGTQTIINFLIKNQLYLFTKKISFDSLFFKRELLIDFLGIQIIANDRDILRGVKSIIVNNMKKFLNNMMYNTKLFNQIKSEDFFTEKLDKVNEKNLFFSKIQPFNINFNQPGYDFSNIFDIKTIDLLSSININFLYNNINFDNNSNFYKKISLNVYNTTNKQLDLIMNYKHPNYKYLNGADEVIDIYYINMSDTPTNHNLFTDVYINLPDFFALNVTYTIQYDASTPQNIINLTINIYKHDDTTQYNLPQNETKRFKVFIKKDYKKMFITYENILEEKYIIFIMKNIIYLDYNNIKVINNVILDNLTHNAEPVNLKKNFYYYFSSVELYKNRFIENVQINKNFPPTDNIYNNIRFKTQNQNRLFLYFNNCENFGDNHLINYFNFVTENQ